MFLSNEKDSVIETDTMKFLFIPHSVYIEPDTAQLQSQVEDPIT